jgi:hypothetical protein
MTEANMNGKSSAFDELNELERLAAPMGECVHEAAGLSSTRPFDQKAHDLLLQSIDQVADDWVTELTHVRRNSEEIEKLVLQRASKVKVDITALYLLGNAALAEAKRGEEVNSKLAGELDRLIEQRA